MYARALITTTGPQSPIHYRSVNRAIPLLLPRIVVCINSNYSHVFRSAIPFGTCIFSGIQNSRASHVRCIGQFPVIGSLRLHPYFDRCQSGSSTPGAIIGLPCTWSPRTLSDHASRINSKRSSRCPSKCPFTIPRESVVRVIWISTCIGILSRFLNLVKPALSLNINKERLWLNRLISCCRQGYRFIPQSPICLRRHPITDKIPERRILQ